MGSKTLNLKSLARLAVIVLLTVVNTSAHDGLHEQIAEVTALLSRDPKNAALYLKRGELHRLHRDWGRAAADYDRAARLQPALAVVDFARGRMLFEAGRPRPAQAALDRFLSQHPDHVEALVTRARVLISLGQRAAAARDLSQAIAHSPQPELFVERAQTLAAEGDVYVSEALRGLDEGVARHGPLVTLQLYAIDLELRRRCYDAALARLETVAAVSPRKETWLARRGEILALAGRASEARAAFAAALAAVESLPSDRRRTRAVAELEARVRAALVGSNR